MDEKAQTDLQLLVERAVELQSNYDPDIEGGETPGGDDGVLSQQSDDTQYRKDMNHAKALERMERKVDNLRGQIVDLEVENDHYKGRCDEKDKEIELIKEEVRDQRQVIDRYKKSDNNEMKNIDRISQLEGDCKFKDEEIVELNQEISYLRQQKKAKIEELEE
jgi:chromosome segregation ATPase